MSSNGTVLSVNGGSFVGSIIINQKDYYNKVYGGWMGKNIGGTLGGPVEGKKELLQLTFYPNLSKEGPLPNDDLDLQLVWLHALEQYGPSLTARELGQEWVEHVFFPYDEYGYGITNLRRGIFPPVSGWFNNPFNNCMGSPIRSEIWSMIAPGSPKVAAHYAYEDAIVDHAGGEGVYGEVFFAAIESAAFIESDKDRLLDIGLSFIPEDCRTAKAVVDLREWHAEGKSWTEARELVLKHHGRDNFTDAPQNIAFTILGLLYGNDFEDAILKAVNCGYDTDCTAATLGAILGILLGRYALPEKWITPIGDRIKVSKEVMGFNAPVDLEELAQRTMAICKQVLVAWDLPVLISSVYAKSGICVSSKYGVQENVSSDEKIELKDYFKENKYVLPQGSLCNPELEVTIEYGDEGPAIGISQEKHLVVRIINYSSNQFDGTIEILTPDGWTSPEKIHLRLDSGATKAIQMIVISSNVVEPDYDLTLKIQRHYNDRLWNKYLIPFSLVAAANWIVSGPDGMEAAIVCNGNKIEFDKILDTSLKGIYKARTTLYNPVERKVRLIVATTLPVKAVLNGNVLFEDKNITEFMPAYHRAPSTKLAETIIPSGKSILEIEVDRQNLPLEVYVLPVESSEVKKPGWVYYLTDILFI